MNIHISRQSFIATSTEVTPKGGLVRESYGEWPEKSIAQIYVYMIYIYNIVYIDIYILYVPPENEHVPKKGTILKRSLLKKKS